MTNYKFDLDDLVECDSFVVIAIHSELEDYRLAYILNKVLDLKLKRAQKDLDVAEATYSLFEWEDTNQLITWNLLSNICRIEQGINKNTQSLFNDITNIIRTYSLLPEYKASNYILKISHQTNFFKEQQVIEKLLAIPQIILAYKVETDNLKSKTNLIIN